MRKNRFREQSSNHHFSRLCLSSGGLGLGICDRSPGRYSPWKTNVYALKNNGWKMKLPFKMVPFHGTCEFFGGGASMPWYIVGNFETSNTSNQSTFPQKNPTFCTPLSTEIRSGERKSSVIGGDAAAFHGRSWRIIPRTGKWLGSPPPIYKPYMKRPFWKGSHNLTDRGRYFFTVGEKNHWTKSWDDPPSLGVKWKEVLEERIAYPPWN